MLINIPNELYEDIQKLIKDKQGKNKDKVEFDIDTLISKDKSNLEKKGQSEYWGEELTLKRNWKSSPTHPECFLAYITKEEAKLLRTLGLGYSLIDGKYKQHFDKDKIPSFNGDFGSNEKGDDRGDGTDAASQANGGGIGGAGGSVDTGSLGGGSNTGRDNDSGSIFDSIFGTKTPTIESWDLNGNGINDKYEARVNELTGGASDAWGFEQKALEAQIEREVEDYIASLEAQANYTQYTHQYTDKISELTNGAFDGTTAYYDAPTNTVYGYGNNGSWSISYDANGEITDVYASTNDVYGDYTQGLSTSWNSNTLGSSQVTVGYSTQTGLAGDVSVQEELMLNLNIAGLNLDLSLFGGISVNGYSLGFFGNIGYKLGGIKTAQVLETLSIGYNFYNAVGMFQSGMGLASLGYQGFGLLATAGAGYSMYSSLTGAMALYGYDSGVATNVALNNDYGTDGTVRPNFIDSLELLTKNIEIEESQTRLNFYNDVATGTIYDRFAGGMLYDIKSAGNLYFDATDINNPKISVGGIFDISSHSKRINNPYKDFDFPNMAGSEFWRVTT